MIWSSRATLRWVLLLSGVLAVAFPARADRRVALLDFTADDNSWPATQAAVDFTAVLQAQLSGAAGVEWVERAQLKLAERELRMSELGLMAGSEAVRRGKWVKADWLLQGRFGFGDDGRRIVRLDLLDLNHAELLGEKTVALGPDPAIRASADQLAPVARATKALLIEGEQWLQRATNQVVVSPIFFSEVSSWPHGSRGVLRPLERRFQEFLNEWATQNASIRLLRFPKAYQSLDEAVLSSSGWAEANPWQTLANLYVWGNCEVMDVRNSERKLVGKTLRITVNAWDGRGEPARFEERQSLEPREEIPLPKAIAALDGMLKQAVRLARTGNGKADSPEVRQRIARSLLKDFESLTPERGTAVGLTHSDDEREQFMDLVRMLEAACFFDPDNPAAHARRISTRWGWWIDFGRMSVSSEFWSKWRRSEEWGKYVERFGLAPVISLPFPYHRGIAGAYEDSIRDIADMMRTYNKGEAYGFPTGVPKAVEERWADEIEAEVRKRKERAAVEYAKQDEMQKKTPPPTNSPPARTNRPQSATLPPAWSPATARTESSVNNAPRPFDWQKSLPPLFAVHRPSLLPPEFSAKIETIEFPERAAVTVVNQLLVQGDELWLVAEDEKSEGANVPQPDITTEVSAEASRVWTVSLAEPKPRLFQPVGAPRFVASVAKQGKALWLAGTGIARVEPESGRVQSFGVREGFVLGNTTSVCASEVGDVYAVGDSCRLLRLPVQGTRWEEISIRSGGARSWGTGNPLRIAAHQDQLLLIAGALVVRDSASSGWTNFGAIQRDTHAVAMDASGFWIASDQGLSQLAGSPARLRSWQPEAYPSWQAPQWLTTPSLRWVGMSQPTVPGIGSRSNEAEAVEGLLQRGFREFAKARRATYERRRAAGQTIDPLELSTRLTTGVTALADDGDFLWLGFKYPGMVMLYHKPSDSLVGHVRLTDSVHSLAVSANHLWIGFGYRETKLARMEKRDLLAAPKSRWVANRVGPKEFSELLAQQSLRQQALLAFFAGDYPRTLAILDRENPNPTDVEALFLRAYCHDPMGLNQPAECRRQFETIIERFAGYPWERVARAALAESEAPLDPAERRAKLLDKVIQNQVERLAAQYDRDGDHKLDRMEFGGFWLALPAYFQVTPPIRFKRGEYDANKDSFVDATELNTLAADLSKAQE